MKKYIFATALLAVAVHASVSQASYTLDFAAYADNVGERGFGFGHTIAGAADFDGYDVTLRAWNTNANSQPTSGDTLGTAASTDDGVFTSGGTLPGTDSPFAYLDSGNAGLGVAQALNGSFQATPSSDDNVSGAAGGTKREVVGISLDRATRFIQFTFRDLSHNLLSSGTIDITFDGGVTWVAKTIGAGGQVAVDEVVGAGQIVGFAYNDTQFYLDSASVLPEPTTVLVWSILSFMGITSTRRRRTAE